jgi:hypothetical protein
VSPSPPSTPSRRAGGAGAARASASESSEGYSEEAALGEDFYTVTHDEVVEAGGTLHAIPSMRDSALHRNLVE